MKSRNLKNPLLLLLTAAIWGSAFVAQSVGMDYVGCFTFSCVRNLIGCLVLLPYIWLTGRKKEAQKTVSPEEKKQENKILAIGGICCGICLCIASNLQQYGIQYTSVGKAGFLTALYIVLVPVLGIFLKKKCGLQVWISVAVAVVGFYLLSVKEGFRLEMGDIYLVLSALMFSVHILVIDYFSPKVDGVKLSCIQFFICGILSGIVMLLTEEPSLGTLLEARIPILYAGVLASGVAYTLQILGQKDFNPTIASLILSLESVFSALAGWLILQQTLTGREKAGCFLIFCAVILAQLPGKKKLQDTAS